MTPEQAAADFIGDLLLLAAVALMAGAAVSWAVAWLSGWRP